MINFSSVPQDSTLGDPVVKFPNITFPAGGGVWELAITLEIIKRNFRFRETNFERIFIKTILDNLY
jgi:hypothetical protein